LYICISSFLMPVTVPSLSTGLAITNPLVRYRALLATKRIDPDPSQYRLALHLQKLYFRLKDYEPEIEYGRRIQQISQAVDKGKIQNDGSDLDAPVARPGVISNLWAQKERRDTLAVTRSLTNHSTAVELDSPQGLMLHGEVGTGKSMLVDLLADCLPNKKKRRWHFNTFMLETFARLEQMRRSSMESPWTEDGATAEEHSLLRLARDMISTSPILFLDEFQLPDRAASKILSNLLTSFFQLGGVLIATSNRMPEELAKASGVEFTPPPSTAMEILGRQFGLGTTQHERRINLSGKGDFADFLDVLKARCEVWAMEGEKDWRRRDSVLIEDPPAMDLDDGSFLFEASTDGYEASRSISPDSTQRLPRISSESSRLPPLYFLHNQASSAQDSTQDDSAWQIAVLRATASSPTSPIHDLPWETAYLPVYGRSLCVPRAYRGTTLWTFDELCGNTLGPADYISLASTFHTIILTDIPTLTWHQKNEARRFITLLDALYEARCRLLIRAESGPDQLFFPSSTSTISTNCSDSPNTAEFREETNPTDQVYSETFAEIHQDLTAPFRPNISSYVVEDSSPRRADRGDPNEDSDFGLNSIPGAGNEMGSRAIDFAQTAAFTGEDERFAYLRAQSRLWEMCGRRWWEARDDDPKRVGEWWRPLAPELRRWERRPPAVASTSTSTSSPPSPLSSQPLSLSSSSSPSSATPPPSPHQPLQTQPAAQKSHLGQHFRDGGSPFRTSREKPPRFEWQHFWGTMTWGRKAGSWGQGVEGLSDEKRRKRKEGTERRGDESG
jgi:protein AFG1